MENLDSISNHEHYVSLTHIAKHCDCLLISQRNHIEVDVNVQNDCTGTNEIVQLWTRQPNQPVHKCCGLIIEYNNIIITRSELASLAHS